MKLLLAAVDVDVVEEDDDEDDDDDDDGLVLDEADEFVPFLFKPPLV